MSANDTGRTVVGRFIRVGREKEAREVGGNTMESLEHRTFHTQK